MTRTSLYPLINRVIASSTAISMAAKPAESKVPLRVNPKGDICLWCTLEDEFRRAAVAIPLGVLLELECERHLFRVSLWPFNASSKARRECSTDTRWCWAVPVGSRLRADTNSTDTHSSECITLWTINGGSGSNSISVIPCDQITETDESGGGW